MAHELYYALYTTGQSCPEISKYQFTNSVIVVFKFVTSQMELLNLTYERKLYWNFADN